MTDRKTRIAQLHAAARERILLLDGSWGVMFQRMGLEEADYRGDRFTEDKYPGQMKGNNDILCLTRPDRVTELHNAYYAAGADILVLGNVLEKNPDMLQTLRSTGKNTNRWNSSSSPVM